MRFYIIGAGMGNPDHMSRYALQCIANANVVLSMPRFAEQYPGAEPCAYRDLARRAVEYNADSVAILVSGDVGFFSASTRLREQLLPHGDVELICGVSSLQAFCAKIGVPYDHLCVRSLHGRAGSLLGAVSYHPRVFALTGGKQNAAAICKELTDAGLGGLTVHLGENLDSAQERIQTGTAKALARKRCGDLAVLLIENTNAVNAREPVRDDMLLRENIPMTKEEVRWVSVNKLAVQRHETVWDVGAGTGAVTFELARKASDGLVYAVEQNADAVTLLRQNRERLGGYNALIIPGKAPNVLEDLPAPDCLFVGGSGGHMRRILELAKTKNPAVRIVVNAVTLETLHEARSALTELSFADVSIIQLAAVRGKAIGAYTMMTANNPVFILSGGPARNAAKTSG